jgi:hypothetical protein
VGKKNSEGGEESGKMKGVREREGEMRSREDERRVREREREHMRRVTWNNVGAGILK